MFEILDGRMAFCQWDIDRKLKTDGLPEGCTILFSNESYPDAIPSSTYLHDGQMICDVPNIFLTYAESIDVNAFPEDEFGNRTTHHKTIAVSAKKKPADYAYSEQEILNYKSIDERLKVVEEKIETGGNVTLSDDGEGNVIITTSNGTLLKLTDDGAGNVVIGA